MGIKKLLLFLNNYQNLVCETKITDYIGKRIAVDISLLLYKIVIGVRNTGSDITNSKGDSVTHIFGLFNKTILLLSHNIIPVYVFDGKPSSLKDNVILSRQKSKQNALIKLKESESETEKIKFYKKSAKITKKELDECRELLELMGIPYVNSPEESDSQCAYLAKSGLVDGVYTEDMDILTFGSPLIIKNLLSSKNKIQEISLNNVLEKLKLTYDEFIDFCILLGCDYSNGISNINYQVIYDYYIQNKNINTTLKALKANNYNVPNHINYEVIKEYYKNAPYIEIEPSHLERQPMKTNELIDLLVNNYGLLKYKIIKKLAVLNKVSKICVLD